MLPRIVLAALGAASWAIAAPAAVDTVDTTSGKVRGHVAAWPAGSGVSEYLGIPYAQPPLGELRFAPPQPLKEKRDIAGDQYAPGCYQMADMSAVNETYIDSFKLDPALMSYSYNMAGGFARNYSEDCLALNVWTKPGSSAPKAVLVWIYGGAFFAGDTAAHYYNGARLAADQDVVVVSMNYRLSVWGFPTAPFMPQHNFGLRDQRLAVEWVRDNIARFGGDPKRITLFGESAGGMSVDYYSYAWTKDPIVNAFIPQSGSVGTMPVGDVRKGDNWFAFTKKLGCGDEKDGEKTLACMRKLPALTITQAVIGSLATGAQFGPSIDETVVFSDYPKRAAAGNFIKRPLLVGATENEGGLISALTQAGLKSFSTQGGLTGTLTSATGSLVHLIANSYVGSLLTSANPLSGLACGAAPAAEARLAQKLPVWRYVFMGEWPNTAIYPGIGAYHSSDCPIVFGATERNRQGIKDTPAEAKFVKMVMGAWAAFAKDPEGGLKKLGWPVYDPKANTVVRLGYQNSSEISLGAPKDFGVSECAFYKGNKVS